MQTSLSLPHTLALSASFTLHPAAISACFLSSLFPSVPPSAPSSFRLRSPSFSQHNDLSPPALLSLFQVLHWSSVRPGGSVSHHPRHRPHHHSHGAGPGTRALAQHHCHRHPERSEVTFYTPLNTETSLELVHSIISFTKSSSMKPPLTPALTNEGVRGLRKCKLYIVRYLKSTVASVWCTSLSGLALESSSHEGNAVWRHK